MARTLVSPGCLLACGLAALALLVSPASAATQVHCGKASLQAAIASAPDGATLVVRGTCSGNFQIVGKSLTLQGSPPVSLVSPAASTAPTLLVNAPGKNVDLVGLTITGGSGSSGGGVRLADGGLTIRSSTITGNRAANGAGIYAAGGELDLSNAKVQGNTATGMGGGIAAAGASVTLTVTTVSGNTAGGFGGGGIAVTGGSLDATASTISGNRSTASGGSAAVIENAVGGGGIRAAGAPVSLVATTVTGNQSSSYGGGVVHGSGLLSIIGSTVTGNSSALDGAGVLNAAVPAVGGDATLVLRGSAILSNTSANGGGAGIANYANGYLASLDAAGSSLGSNRATNGDGGAVSNVAAGGGSATTTLTGGVPGTLGPLSMTKNLARRGGGIYEQGAGALLVVGAGATVSSNTATVAGGGVYNSGGTVAIAGAVSGNKPDNCVGC